MISTNATTLTTADTQENSTLPLCHHVAAAMEHYFSKLDGCKPSELYQLVLKEIEVPLLKTVMHYVRGNQSKAAQVLGLSRGTLRKKLKEYGLC